MTNTSLNLIAEGGKSPIIHTNNNEFHASNTRSELTNSPSEINLNNTFDWRFFVGDHYGIQLPSNYFTQTQFPVSGPSFNILQPNDALTNIVNNVGVNARINADGSVSSNLDQLDEQALKNVLQGIIGEKKSRADYFIPALTSKVREASFYSGNPHIPDTWFRANVPNGQDHNDIAPSGYTWIEEYINQVDKR